MPGCLQRPLAALLSIAAIACSASSDDGDDGDDGDDTAGGDLVGQLEVTSVGVLPADFQAASIVAIDEDRVAVAHAVATGDAFCPDCLELDPTECPAVCERTRLSLAVLDVTTGEVGAEIPIQQVFPQSFEHAVNQVEAVLVGPNRVGVAWLDCDNSSCGGFFAKRSCTARYTVVDLDAATTSPVATLYEDRFGMLQLVAHPASGQVLAVVGMTYGAYGVGVRAAIFDDIGNPLHPWVSLGGVDGLSPAAASTGDGFVVVLDDRRPDDPLPAEPCAASCECSGGIQVDPVRGGLYAHEISSTGTVRGDPIAIGLTDDGHLDGGHYHAREVLGVMQRGTELTVAAGQAIDMEAELFVGRRDAWTRRGGFDSPIPLWLTVLGSPDAVAWLGSQPEPGATSATVSRLVAGVATETGEDYGAISEPIDSYVFEAAPVVTPTGITTTFLLRGIFDRSGSTIAWKHFELVRVSAGW